MKKFFTKKHSWSALLIGMIVIIFLSIFVVSFLEKALRIGQSVKSVEQSTQAYYFATSSIEKQLKSNLELRKKPWTTTGSTVSSGFTGSILTVTSSGSSIPAKWKWNSRDDSDWNIISMDRPIQIVFNNFNKDNLFNNTTRFHFRIPVIETRSVSSLNNSSSWVIYFSVWNSEKIFYLWKDQTITAWDIFSKQNTQSKFIIQMDKKWIVYNPKNIDNPLEDEKNLSDLITSDLDCWDSNNYLCTFKISMLNPIIADNWNIIPFLEYKIEHINWSVPLQFMELDSKWFAGKLIRQRKVELPQITTNTALDFAVLQ